jgi:hypothetical protein
MTRLKLNEIWNDTAAFVKREGRLLFPIALMLNALPMAFAAAMIPEIRPGTLPPPGLWTVLIPVAGFIGLIGSVAIAFLALRPGRTVGEALRRGLSRFLPLLGAYLLVGLALGLVLIVVALVMALLVPGMAGGQPSPGAAAVAVLLLVLLLLPLMLFVATRLLLTTPIAAVEEGGPVAILRRSWELTAPVFWQLLGFLVLTSILAAVINYVAQAIVGIPIILLSGQPRPGSMSAVVLLLVGALVSTVITVYLTTMVAKIHAALSPEGKARVFE